MEIYIYYKDTNKPWGGVNSFVRAFRSFCMGNNIKLADSINDDYDIAFITGPSRNREDPVDLKGLSNLKTIGTTSRFINLFLKRKPKILVYRCDGFKDEYAGLVDNPVDRAQRGCLDIADHVIFQNDFCLRSARRKQVGYCKDNFSVIYNGVNQDLFMPRKDYWDGKRKIRFFSASWSNNPNKGFGLIAEFSRLKDVEVTFCGRWPLTIEKKNVAILPPMPQTELAEEFAKHDVFLHPAQYDPSPNVCLEAISSGLPIIYHPTSGIKEVAGDCGIQIDEDNLHKTLDEIKARYFSLINAIKMKRDFYSIERCGREYLNIFEKLIKRQKNEQPS